MVSQAQALAQCRHGLGKILPQARLIDIVSTTEHAQREEFDAAVACPLDVRASNAVRKRSERLEILGFCPLITYSWPGDSGKRVQCPVS